MKSVPFKDTVGIGAGRRDPTHTFNKISLAVMMQGTSRGGDWTS